MNNSKLVLFVICLFVLMFTAPLVPAAPRGGGGGHGGGHFAGRAGMGTWSGQRGGNWSGRNWSGRNWNGRNWNGRNWSGRNWNGRNWNNWNGNWHHHRGNNVIFIGDFGFPWWWGWAGVRRGAGAIRTDTDIMVLATRTGTAMDTTVATDTTAATDTATPATVMDTATAAGPEWPSYSAGSLAPVITTGPLTASWDRRRVEQFGLTSAIAETQADQVSFA